MKSSESAGGVPALTNIDNYGLELVRVIRDIGIVIEYSKIRDYESKRKEIVTLDIISAPMYMRDFNSACDHVAGIIAKIELALSAAKVEMKAEEAKAKLERAPQYLKDHGLLESMKDSDSLRKTYLNLDEQYKQAVQKHDALEALHKYMVNKLDAFTRDYYSVKSIFTSLNGSPGSKTGYGGLTSGGKIGDTSND